MSRLAEEDEVAIYTYLTRFHRPIDAALRSADAEALREWDAHIRVATIGLSQLPRFEGTVYRGTTLGTAAVAAYVPGTIVREPSFVVASPDPALRFPGNVRYVIRSCNARRVESLSDDPASPLVMFFAGTSFKVLAADPGERSGDHVVYLAEIPDARLMPPPGPH